MRPLQSIAMGLVVIVLDTLGTVDALPDPVGWVLVLLGVRGLPHDLHRRGPLLALGLLAAAVSVPLWLPGVADALYDTHPSLLWAANLPQLGFAGLLCVALAASAAPAGDTAAAAWARTTLTGVAVVAVLPVLVFGAGIASLEVPAYLGTSLVLLLLIWLLFSWSGRPWILRAEPPQAPAPT
jgi:hypothetical protein